MQKRLLTLLWYENNMTFACLMMLMLLLFCVSMVVFFNERYSLYQQRASDLIVLEDGLKFKTSIVAGRSLHHAPPQKMTVRENIWYQLDSQAQLLEFLKDMVGRNIEMKNITIEKHKFYWMVFFL